MHDNATEAVIDEGPSDNRFVPRFYRQNMPPHPSGVRDQTDLGSSAAECRIGR